MQKLNIHHDFRKNIYEQIQSLEFEGIKQFYQTEVQSIHFNTAIIGKKENLDMEAVNKMGTFKEVSLKDIFGH